MERRRESADFRGTWCSPRHGSRDRAVPAVVCRCPRIHLVLRFGVPDPSCRRLFPSGRPASVPLSRRMDRVDPMDPHTPLFRVERRIGGVGAVGGLLVPVVLIQSPLNSTLDNPLGIILVEELLFLSVCTAIFRTTARTSLRQQPTTHGISGFQSKQGGGGGASTDADPSQPLSIGTDGCHQASPNPKPRRTPNLAEASSLPSRVTSRIG